MKKIDVRFLRFTQRYDQYYVFTFSLGPYLLLMILMKNFLSFQFPISKYEGA